MTKLCSKCHIEKSIDEFYRHSRSKDGYDGWCKLCQDECSKRYHATEQGKIITREIKKKYRKTDSGKASNRKYALSEKGKVGQRKNQIKHLYGLTLEDVDNILIQQNHMCPICGILLAETRRCIDHNHYNNTVRGILCHSCNVGLGHLKENIEILKKAIEYLEK